jgi:hypothetical protein
MDLANPAPSQRFGVTVDTTDGVQPPERWLACSQLTQSIRVSVTAEPLLFFIFVSCHGRNFANLENWANPDTTAEDGVAMDTPGECPTMLLLKLRACIGNVAR